MDETYDQYKEFQLTKDPKHGIEMPHYEKYKPDEGCEGCPSHGNKFYHKHLESEKFKWVVCTPTKDICPCSLCVVKTMCQSTCDLYRIYRKYPGTVSGVAVNLKG